MCDYVLNITKTTVSYKKNSHHKLLRYFYRTVHITFTECEFKWNLNKHVFRAFIFALP